MSTITKQLLKCAVCGNEHIFDVVMSTSENGYMDLDTRPPKMKRDNLAYEVQSCPHCHYSNRNIESLIQDFDFDALQSPDYVSIFADNKMNDTAKAYLSAAYLQAKHNNYRDAGILYLNAAWVFDDLLDADNAKSARDEALKYLCIFVEESADLHIATLTVDLQRRNCDFSGAIDTANQLVEYGVDEFLEKVLKLEIKLSRNADSSCHNVGEVE